MGCDDERTDGLTGAEKYFAKGLYDSSVGAQLATKGTTLRIGIKCTSASTAYWTMFDNFRLHFFGGANAPDSVEEMVKGETGHEKVLYDLQGRRVEATPKKGIYIVNGKKVVISK